MEEPLNGLIRISRGDDMSKKAENAEFARKWVNDITNNRTWRHAVDRSIISTHVYTGDMIEDDDITYIKSKAYSEDTVIKVNADKTYDAIRECYYKGDLNVCVLNFASFFNPGGGFLKGAFAQEESLCAVSGLYNILSKLDIYTDRAKREKVAPEYDNEIIYSQFVPFTDCPTTLGMPYCVDIISCAAPNCNRLSMAQQEFYMSALRKRIKAIYYLPYLNGCDTLILGAWGCGVFKNDPGLIANLFAEVIAECPGIYKSIIFACGSKDNAEVFRNVIH